MQGAELVDLKDVFLKQIRSVLEFGVPVWNSGLTKEDSYDIERIQKSFMHIVLDERYLNYASALDIMGMESLAERIQICKNFAIKAAKHPKHSSWFKTNEPVSTRSDKQTYRDPVSRLTRQPYSLFNQHVKQEVRICI